MGHKPRSDSPTAITNRQGGSWGSRDCQPRKVWNSFHRFLFKFRASIDDDATPKDWETYMDKLLTLLLAYAMASTAAIPGGRLSLNHWTS